jgi:hypothetical protein
LFIGALYALRTNNATSSTQVFDILIMAAVLKVAFISHNNNEEMRYNNNVLGINNSNANLITIQYN